jgi:hypothetical protein
MKYILIPVIISMFISCKGQEDKNIIEAVDYQVKNYPQSTLQDLYKNFFQDVYGPGHLLSDTSTAMDYLRAELKMVKEKSLVQTAEGTGYKNRFVRVDLFPVSEGIIPFDEFGSAFSESAKKFDVPDIEEWKEEWKKILSAIESMDIQLNDFEKDKQMIDELLNQGKFVIHHSPGYSEAYDPHYRLIEKGIYRKRLRKYLR